MNNYTFTKIIDSGGWRDVGTITLKKGVYIISASYVFTASAVDGLRGCYLSNNVAWNGPYIMDMIRTTGYTGKTQPTRGSMSACVEVLEDTIVTVRSIQDAGVNLTSDVFVSIVKLS